ncbi:ATP-binding protein [Nocardiopsis sp. NPDC101807]|uniref:ATP-binding protein n=1 Tax=Nocardiopsis sp. NPDC101807 TaxID=3364339 RepID=UPI00382C3053
MQPTATPAPKPDPASGPAVPYPHRIGFTEPHRHGILLGHERDYTALSNWVHTVVPRRPRRNALQVARALVSNAHRHTRSGDPGGTVRVVVDVNPFLVTVAVTDGGPLGGTAVPCPCLGDAHRSPLPGLHLVDHLAVYWDWEWEWKGTALGPLTVRAVIENP